jgi:hypothetical protein
MSYLKPSIGVVLLVMMISSTALAGNIAPTRSGNIAPSRSGNIAPSRSGNIAPSRSGNIAPSRSGNIAPSRAGIIPTQPGDSPLDTRGFVFTSLMQLLLETGLFF